MEGCRHRGVCGQPGHQEHGDHKARHRPWGERASAPCKTCRSQVCGPACIHAVARARMLASETLLSWCVDPMTSCALQPVTRSTSQAGCCLCPQSWVTDFLKGNLPQACLRASISCAIFHEGAAAAAAGAGLISSIARKLPKFRASQIVSTR